MFLAWGDVGFFKYALQSVQQSNKFSDVTRFEKSVYTWKS